MNKREVAKNTARTTHNTCKLMNKRQVAVDGANSTHPAHTREGAPSGHLHR